MKQELTVKTNLQPPATKTEIIEALLQLKFEAWKKKNDADTAEMKSLAEKLGRTAFGQIKKLKFEDADVDIQRWVNGQIKVSLSVDPLDAGIFARHNFLSKSLKCFDEKFERTEICKSLQKAKGTRNLLDDADTRKKLVALGTQIGVM